MTQATLRETDITKLKELASLAAYHLAQKAATFDEYHQIVAAYEKELNRINQLDFIPTETPNPRDLLNRKDRRLLEKAEKLEQSGKLRFIERFGSSES